jgi:radical SAM superfamily enzyme YgiQ (UPF0313 family)
MQHPRPTSIFFADLNHEGHNIKTFPLAAGCVASYARAALGSQISIELFKSPNAFADALIANPPHIVGFSNYMWNFHLSYEVVKRLKMIHPETIVIMGGPNYPEDSARQLEFLRKYHLIDFYVIKEGEIPFVELFRALDDCDFIPSRLKDERVVIPGCQYAHHGEFIAGGPSGKFTNLDDIPSPYLSGLFDKFFDEGLEPLMQFTRGCPFACTFCGEGLNYYNKLGRSSLGRFASELEYAGQRVNGSPTLYLADANFGMYKEDLEASKEIATVQNKYGWPEKMNTSTGKNQQERILNVTSMLNGALRFGAALQSTDKGVLSNIKRANISIEKLMGAAKRVRELGQVSYSEIILNLPGETVETHIQSIRTPIEAGITRIQMYPLTLLPGTEMENLESRHKYGTKTKFRILPRCFGVYRFGDLSYPSAEIVEMVVEQDSMSFQDYLYCKEFELSVELFYNDHYFEEIRGLLEHLGLSMFNFIKACHELLPEFPDDLKALYAGLRNAVTEELWDSRESIESVVQDRDKLGQYERDEHKNSLATNRAIGVMACAKSIHKVAHQAIHKCLRQEGIDDPMLDEYIEGALRFSLLRKDDLLRTSDTLTATFDFDFLGLKEQGFAGDPLRFRLPEPRQLRFWHDRKWAREIRRLYEAYDDPVLGMRNVLYHSQNAPTSDYFRSFGYVGQLAAEELVSR